MTPYQDMLTMPQLIEALKNQPISNIALVNLIEKDRQGEHNGSRFNVILELDEGDLCFTFSVIVWDHFTSYHILHLFTQHLACLNLNSCMKELRKDLLQMFEDSID